MHKRVRRAGLLAIERPTSIKELTLVAEFPKAEAPSNESCSNTRGMWILGGFPPEGKARMSKGAWTALPPGPLALTPGFVNHDCETAESWSTGASPSQRILVATGYLCSGSVCALHLKKPPRPPDGGEAESRCRGVHTEARRPRGCCSGCCASGERSMFAAPASPPVSRFPARALPTACSKSSLQRCEQRDATRPTDEAGSLTLKPCERHGLF